MSREDDYYTNYELTVVVELVYFSLFSFFFAFKSHYYNVIYKICIKKCKKKEKSEKYIMTRNSRP
jgi:hypothetical protein